MGRRQREWAKRKRHELILSLGGVCQICGDDDPENLVIDHHEGRSWDLLKKDSSARVSRYCFEAKLGLVGVLCVKHNSRAAHRRKDPDVEPF